MGLVCINGNICLYSDRYQRREKTLYGLTHFITHSSQGMLMAGLLSVLLFSRLFGMGILWEKLLGEDYNRTVKIWWKKVASCSAIHSV